MTLKRTSKQIVRGHELLDLDDRDYYALKLSEVRDDLKQCRDGGKSTAVAVLHRLEVEIKAKAPPSEVDALDAMDPAKLMDMIADAVVQLPPMLQDQLRDTLDSLASGQVIKMPKPKKGKG